MLKAASPGAARARSRTMTGRRRRSQASTPSRRRALALGVLIALLAALAGAPTALAGKPTGEYAPFTHCPLGTPGLTWCVVITASSGELKLGSATATIKNTITLQGGLIVSGGEETFVEATEGATLSKTPEEVGGGFEGFPLTETLELVGSVALSEAKLAAGEGTALKLPVKAHLKNVFA